LVFVKIKTTEKMSLTHRPLNGRVLVLETKEENKTATGIIIPETKGKIRLAKGKAIRVDKSIPADVLQPGETVYFRQGIGYEVQLPDEAGSIKTYLIIPAVNLELVNTEG
jgi:co-chaperonin GroES (HSP10)